MNAKQFELLCKHLEVLVELLAELKIDLIKLKSMLEVLDDKGRL